MRRRTWLKQEPIEGESMVDTFDEKNADAPSTHPTQHFEANVDHAIHQEGGSPVPRSSKHLGTTQEQPNWIRLAIPGNTTISR